MNIKADILDAVRKEADERTFMATVVAVAGGTVQVQAVGSQSPIQQFLATLYSYASPAIGHVVLVEKVGTGHVVTGRIRNS